VPESLLFVRRGGKKKESNTLGNMTSMIAEWLLIESDHVVSGGGRHDSPLSDRKKKGYDNTFIPLSFNSIPSLLSQSDMPTRDQDLLHNS
jgi:hypothetical protein